MENNKKRRYKTVCKHCNTELEFTYDDVYFGFILPESIKCPHCGEFTLLEFKWIEI